MTKPFTVRTHDGAIEVDFDGPAEPEPASLVILHVLSATDGGGRLEFGTGHVDLRGAGEARLSAVLDRDEALKLIQRISEECHHSEEVA